MKEDEAKLLVNNPLYASFFENTLKFYNNPKNISNWFFNEILSYTTSDFNLSHIAPKDFAVFLTKIDKNEISGKIGKSIIKKSFDTNQNIIKIMDEEGG